MVDASRYFIPRRATLQNDRDGSSETRLLADWAHLDAYVLLAEPGAGKSWAFQQEALSDAVGSKLLKKARDFVTLSPRPDWHGKTLFIDGLDEMRVSAGQKDGFDGVRRRLDELDRPRFRLSCREADWLGAIDAQALCAVAPGGEVAVLRLEPLQRADIEDLLRHGPDQVSDVAEFMRRADQQQALPLLSNPLMLKLMVNALRVRDDQWPEGRRDTYQLACEHLATEANEFHRKASRNKPVNVDALLDDAGLLCAVLLLANGDAFTDNPLSPAGNSMRVDRLPMELGVRDAAAVFASQIFVTEGDERYPRHRTIAEYLAARSIARRVMDEGLSINRVLSLMSLDGGIVEPLRGLSAWLAVHCRDYPRRLLGDLDPLGVVLYGDVRSFNALEKRQVLDSLHREALRFRWFRGSHWDSHPFGALGTQDMAATFLALLSSPSRDPAHQSLLDCVLDAVKHGEDMPDLVNALIGVVRDSSYRADVRGAALDAWWRQSKGDGIKAVGLLDDVRAGAIDDPADELCGQLLAWLYPTHLSALETLQHLRQASGSGYIYRTFWTNEFIDKIPADELPMVVDALAAQVSTWESVRSEYEHHGFIGELIWRGLNYSGASEPTQRLYQWLSAGLDEYETSYLAQHESTKIGDWLSEHPDVQKRLYLHAVSTMPADPSQGRLHIHNATARFYRAARPSDWPKWLLMQAATTDNAVFAQDCLVQAALESINPASPYDISMEDVEGWLEKHRHQWSMPADDSLYDPWLSHVWWLPMDHWQGAQFQRRHERDAAKIMAQQKRHAELCSHRDAIKAGTAPAGLMHQITLAYEKRFSDIEGDTPEARVQSFLGGSSEDALAAIEGIKLVLSRDDLPSVEEILDLDLKQQYHWIRPVCLLAAELITQEQPRAAARWCDALSLQMAAFYLTDRTREVQAWYRLLVEERPQLVAQVMGPYVQGRILKCASFPIGGLWALANEDSHRDLARQILPSLLRRFPARATQSQLSELTSSLLLAAEKHLEPEVFKGIVADRLALKSLDAGQRITWMVVASHVDPTADSGALLTFIGRSQSRAAHLVHALEYQFRRTQHWARLPIEVTSRLIEVLAPHASPEFLEGGGVVTDSERRRDVVRPLIRQLAALPDPLAGQALQRLRSNPALKHWFVELDASLYEHVRVARAAHFSHASDLEVALTLANQAPANALDLVALLVDQLRLLGRKIRGDETNGLKLFRRVDEEAPEIENYCRDLLLSKLREPLLHHHVDLLPEASAAQGKRADLRATVLIRGRRMAIPVEIKLDSDRGAGARRASVWTAWRDQLDRLYVIDPASQGVGLYLVLWFGRKPNGNPEGVVPKNAPDMERLLTERIPVDERHRLKVVVLDLSWP